MRKYKKARSRQIRVSRDIHAKLRLLSFRENAPISKVADRLIRNGFMVMHRLRTERRR